MSRSNTIQVVRIFFQQFIKIVNFFRSNDNRCLPTVYKIAVENPLIQLFCTIIYLQNKYNFQISLLWYFKYCASDRIMN